MGSKKRPAEDISPVDENLQLFFSDLLSEANRLGEAFPGSTPAGAKFREALNSVVAQSNEAVAELLSRLKSAIENYPDDLNSMPFDSFLEAHPEIFNGDTQNAYYHMLVQGKTSNKLQKKITERITGEQATQLDLWGNGSIADRDFKLYVRGYSELLNGVNQSAARLLDSLMITATKEGLKSTLIKLPLRDYMKMRGLRDEKDTRAQVKRDIDALERISFEYKGTGKQRGAWLKVSIAGGTVGQIKNGDIIFRFNQDWYDSFKASETGKLMYMYFPREALRTNINSNPWTYWLARKISEHKRMNLGKTNEDIISVSTLIEACPNFPTRDEVMAGNRNLTQRIIEPFERDMDALTESLSWHYTSDEPPADYNSFIAATVTIHWNDYPNTKTLMAHKVQRAKRSTPTARSKKDEK